MSEIKFSTENKKNNNQQFKTGWIWAGIIGVVLLIIAFNSFVIVNEGFIGVRYRFGAVVQSDMEPGLRLKVPFIEEIRPVDMREQIYLFQGNAFTKDTQPVNDLHLKATYRYERSRLNDLISDVGIDNIPDRYFVPNVQRIAKDIIGRYDADKLVQSRSEVQQIIEDELSEWLEVRGVILTSFSIENINFEPAFLAAVENKVVAEQNVAQMRHRTEERRVEAEQIRIAAEAEAARITTEATAEAEAIELIQAQLADSPAYIEYLKIINWNGILPQVIGDGVNPFVVLDSGGFANRTASSPAPTQTTNNE